MSIHRDITLEQKLTLCSLTGYLDLTECELRDEDIPTIIQLIVRERKCKSLSLSKNSMTSFGAKIFVDELINTKNTTLKGLVLEDKCSLGDCQSQEVARILMSGYPPLREIYFSKDALEDDGVILLCRVLQRNITLQYFYALMNMKITDACIDSFIQMLQSNKTLHGLYLLLCSLSEDGKRRLEEAVSDRKRFILLI